MICNTYSYILIFHAFLFWIGIGLTTVKQLLMPLSLAIDGTCTAKFSWKPDHPHLPSNLEICEKHTRHLITRLVESPAIFQLYKNIITDQEAHGFVEKVPPNCLPVNVHYRPHHPVTEDSATTPIRIVYDCKVRNMQASTTRSTILE